MGPHRHDRWASLISKFKTAAPTAAETPPMSKSQGDAGIPIATNRRLDAIGPYPRIIILVKDVIETPDDPHAIADDRPFDREIPNGISWDARDADGAGIIAVIPEMILDPLPGE